MCGQTVTFPAIPPRKPGDPSLTLKSGGTRAPRSSTWKWPRALAWIGRIKHWGIVAQCIVPFLLIVGLLFGASYVKRMFSEPSASSPDANLHADPETWQKMTDLTKADEAARQRLQELNSARAALQVAYSILNSPQQVAPDQRRAADQAAKRAELTVRVAERNFSIAMQNYQRLGGTINYNDQVQR
jgi:hypothetical protein